MIKKILAYMLLVFLTSSFIWVTVDYSYKNHYESSILSAAGVCSFIGLTLISIYEVTKNKK